MQVLDKILPFAEQKVIPFFKDNMNYTIGVSVGIVLYIIYLYIFKYHIVEMRGNYNIQHKNMGKPLPPYPNGWYVVARSSQLKVGQSLAIDQSGHNVTIFRSDKGQVYGLHSYCAHLGANLGIGGKVVNQKCIQCPFHGWLYDGQTGKCVDYNNKPAKVLNVQYNDDFGSHECKKVQWKHGKQQTASLRKYHVKQQHGLIYVWFHVDQTVQPQFEFFNVQKIINPLSNRGYTLHHIRCHPQDIPENGADIFHFKYVHKYPITGIKFMQFLWTPEWMAGDNPDLPKLFEHQNKGIRQFKQMIYNNYVKNEKNKQHFSFANVDNYLVFPIIGKIFVFNLTIIQMGSGLVYVFLKTPFFTVTLVQWIISHKPFQHQLYHQMYASSYLPYWLTAIMLRGQAIQVYNDMLIWQSKQFASKIGYKQVQADEFVLKWRAWFSKYYTGTKAAQQGVSW